MARMCGTIYALQQSSLRENVYRSRRPKSSAGWGAGWGDRHSSRVANFAGFTLGCLPSPEPTPLLLPATRARCPRAVWRRAPSAFRQPMGRCHDDTLMDSNGRHFRTAARNTKRRARLRGIFRRRRISPSPRRRYLRVYDLRPRDPPRRHWRHGTNIQYLQQQPVLRQRPIFSAPTPGRARFRRPPSTTGS